MRVLLATRERFVHLLQPDALHQIGVICRSVVRGGASDFFRMHRLRKITKLIPRGDEMGIHPICIRWCTLLYEIERNWLPD
jgi:hypothetical protein